MGNYFPLKMPPCFLVLCGHYGLNHGLLDRGMSQKGDYGLIFPVDTSVMPLTKRGRVCTVQDVLEAIVNGDVSDFEIEDSSSEEEGIEQDGKDQDFAFNDNESESSMAHALRYLSADNNRYLKSFQLFLQRSSQQQCMLDFIHGVLPDILASIGGGSSSLKIMGVGSGSGEMDLEMLSQLHLKHPGLKVDNEVVEPSAEMLHNYKVLLSKTPNLEYINFRWNQMTASEFENHWREKNLSKKMDFIHMIQVLYYVADPRATVSFFRSLLNKNGKLMIVLINDTTGQARLRKILKADLYMTEYLVIENIKSFLDADGIKYKSYLLPTQVDITECFREGDEKGEMLLDFLSGVLDFSKSTPPELKAHLMGFLRHPDCCAEVDGKIFSDNTSEILVLDA